MPQWQGKGKQTKWKRGLRLVINPVNFVIMLQPVIGYTLDHETGGGYSKLPWYAIRENYLHSAIDQNALAIALSHKPEQASAYLDLMDGLVIIGGDFDIDPALYGDTSTHETVRLKETRTAFEWAITEQAIARGMPVLGICGGQQLLAVVLGGTLIQHIPEAINTDIAHEQPNPRHEVGHTVRLTAGSLLHQIIGQD